MYTDKTLKPVRKGDQYIAEDGTQYPHNFPKDEIAGLVKVTETERPTDPLLIVTGFVIDKNYVQVWETREKTVEEITSENKQAKLSKRQAALAMVWPDAFAIVDDILLNGTEAVTGA